MDETSDSSSLGPPVDVPRFAASRGRWKRICIKELKETLRDRRTIVTLVFMPLLVYPLLSVVFHRFFVTSFDSVQQQKLMIGIDSEENGRRLQRFLLLGDALLTTVPGSAERALALENLNGEDFTSPAAFAAVEFAIGEDLQSGVEDGRLSLAVWIKRTSDPPRVGEFEPIQCELVYRENTPSSNDAMQFVRERLQAVNQYYLERQLVESGLPATLPTVSTTRAVQGEVEQFSLTTLIPLILILMTITGAVYPAIDLTAGERERGTLEPLMAAPIPRIRLLLAKYFAVVSVALLTAVANLIAMTITLASTGLGKILFGDDGMTFRLVASVFALLILFAAFFSAIVLALTSFARSFKEAQAYLIPLMLLCLAPGILSLMPGLEFSRILAITPLVNIVLLARDLFKGETDPVLAGMAVASTALYALAAVCIAARIFGTDAILYGSQASWSDLWRRPDQPRLAATIPGAAWCLALAFPCFVVLSSLLGLVPTSTTGRLVLAGCATAIVFGGVPLACAVMQHVRIGRGFQLNKTTPLAFLAALLLGLSLWPFAHELFLLNETLGLHPLGEQQKELARKLMEELLGVNTVVVLLALAFSPAVFEELLFRGFLFNALQQRFSPRTTILMTAVVFGAFHVVAASALSPERFLPSTFLGLFLGWVCYRSGSVLPGIVLHALHNGLLLMLLKLPKDWPFLDAWDISDEGHLPGVWLAAAAVCVALAMAILLLGTRQRTAVEP